MSEEKPTDETLKRQAYLEALNLYNSGADAELIYARLDKKGFPEELIRQVLRNLYQHDEEKVQEAAGNSFHIGIIILGVGICILIGSAFFLPTVTVIPIGLILGGAVIAAIAWAKKKNK